MKANETNFITLLKTRQEDGILYVIETYGGLLKSIVRKRLFAFPDKVDECMNDIFFGIWLNIDSYDEAKGSFTNWASGVARLEAIDALRKIQREKSTVPLEDIEITQEDQALLDVVEQELSEETTAILSCLSEKDQELFRRIYMEEEDPAKTGQAMGLSRDNVYVRLFRGKKKIRRNLSNRKETNT